MTRRYPGLDLLDASVVHLGTFLEALSMRYGDRPALQIRQGDRLLSHSYRDLFQHASRMAAHLETLGVMAGDRVALLGENTPQWLMSYFAIASLGAVAVPLDPQLTKNELSNLIDHCEAKAVFCPERWVEPLGPDRATLPLLPATFEALDQPPAPMHRGTGDELAAILYTSGTTGSPKGVMLTHDNLLSNVRGCSEVLYIKDEDVLMSLLPLHHAYAFTTTLIGLAAGIPVVFPPSLKPDAVVATLRLARVTALPAVPLLVDHLARGLQEQLKAQPPARRLLAEGLIGLSRALRPILGARVARTLCRPITRHLGRLRGMVIGGAALSPESARFFDALGIIIIHGYGLTETAPVVALTPHPWRAGDGVGLPLKGLEVRIAGPNGEGVGEVLVRGRCVMRGYFRDPEASAEALTDGWLRTGDLGRLDERGYLQLAGRSKNVIVLANGKNVYPEELELHYGQSELIAELCVITGRAEDGSEAPFGVIVPSDKARTLAADDSDKALRTLLSRELTRLSSGLADYKRLKRFALQQEAMPQTTSRKVRRHVVQAEYRDLSASAGS